MFTRMILVTVFCCTWLLSYAQEELATSHTVKIHQTVNPYEYGTGLSYQYYLHKKVGLQTNMTVLFPFSDYEYTTDYHISGSGFRFNPELRFYPKRNREGKYTSFFIGLGPVIKTFEMKEQQWTNQYDSYSASSFQQFSITKFTNMSYGAMATLGVEGYIGRSKRFVYDVAYSFGLTHNNVKMTGDHIERNTIFDDLISVTNRDDGVFPYVDLRIGVGYRLGK